MEEQDCLLTGEEEARKHIIRNFSSRSGVKYSLNLKGRETYWRLDEMVRLVVMSRPRMRKAHARIVHGKPILGIKWTAMIGKITPPNDEPTITTPPAIPRFFLK